MKQRNNNNVTSRPMSNQGGVNAPLPDKGTKGNNVTTPPSPDEFRERALQLQIEKHAPIVDAPTTPPMPDKGTKGNNVTTPNAPSFVVHVGQQGASRELCVYVNCRVDTPVDVMMKIAQQYTSLYGGIAPCDMSFVDDHNITHTYTKGAIVPRAGDAMKRKGKGIRGHGRQWGVYGGENAIRTTTRDTKFVSSSGVVNIERVRNKMLRNGAQIVDDVPAT
jgi:hypothetical protein